MTATRLRGRAGHAGRFAVPSASTPGRTYNVIWMGPDLADCACAGFTYRGTCSHLKAVEELVATELRDRREVAAVALREIGELFDCGD